MSVPANFMPASNTPLIFTSLDPSEDMDCEICWCPLTENATRHEGGCAFHIDCIAKWLRMNPICPVTLAAADADSVFKQQSFIDRNIQAVQYFGYKKKALACFNAAKPYIITAIPYGVRYGIPAVIAGYTIHSMDALAESTGYQSSITPILKTIIAGVVLYSVVKGELPY